VHASYRAPLLAWPWSAKSESTSWSRKGKFEWAGGLQSSTMLNSMVCGVAKVEEAVINRHSAQSQRSEVPLVKSIEVRRISHLDLKRGAESAVAVFSLTDMPQAQGGSPNSGV
jgi:hypothetical protein